MQGLPLKADFIWPPESGVRVLTTRVAFLVPAAVEGRRQDGSESSGQALPGFVLGPLPRKLLSAVFHVHMNVDSR